MPVCYIGLGSNLEQPRQQIVDAISALASLESSALTGVSSLYRSHPLGPQDQPNYINAVVELKTSLSALALLSQLQAIESEHERVRVQHWGPRTLDLDLLLYGEEEISHERLQVPHPELANRNFVLIPLYEIVADMTIPGAGKLKDLVVKMDRSGLQKLQPDE